MKRLVTINGKVVQITGGVVVSELSLGQVVLDFTYDGIKYRGLFDAICPLERPAVIIASVHSTSLSAIGEEQ